MIEFDNIIDITYPGVTVRPEAWEDPDIFPIFDAEFNMGDGEERYTNNLGEGDGGVPLSNRAHPINYDDLSKRVSAMIDLLYSCKPEQISRNKEQTVELCKKCLRVREAYLAAILRIALINSRDRDVPENKIVIEETGIKRDTVKNALKIALENFSYSELKDILEEAKGEIK